jgi:hypothetical protein
MQDAEATAGIATLTLDVQSPSIDCSVREVATPSGVYAGRNSRVSLKQRDVIALRAELDWLDSIEHPWGPFPNYQRHLEYILSQYDAASPRRHNSQDSTIDTRRDSLQ